MDLKLLENVEDYKEFLTTEELNEKLMGLSKNNMIELIKLGESQNNFPIYCAKIGSGDKKS